MLSKEPVRIRHNWDSAVVAECDFCSHTKMTVPRADSGRICASCCDSEFLSSWQGYAKSLETEILSLREQYKSQSNELTAMTAAAQALRDEMYKCDAKLEALAALPPVGGVISKKLIGWRTEDYTHETNNIELARNWAPNVGVLPIFEGDINTSISTTTIDTTPLY
ncbi:MULTISPECIES: hypothetical protein [Yersinia pseudotuberculosis complex]|nr:MULTISPECIES: hypothetical protein [Yersinia pseudotuberculosis complex]